MEYNTTAAFHTRKNNYNSSPIDLATKIHQFCLEDKSVDLWLFSGEVLEKSERKYCNLLSGKYSTHFTHCPSQMEILLFLGKISEMMADSSTVLQTIKRKNGWWMFNLCQYIKIKEDVEKPVSEDKEEKALPKSVKCELEKITREISIRCEKEDISNNFLAETGNRILDLISPSVSSSFITSKELVISFANTKRKTDSIITGFEQIDKITGGLKKGEVTLLASRPFKGKTSFALNILHHVCVQGGLATALFSLGLPRKAIFNKLLAISSQVEISKLITGSLNPQEYEKVTREMQKLPKAPFFIDDSTAILTGEIFSRSKELVETLQKQGKELKLIIIDYLQLIRHSQGPTKLPRKEELARIVSLLKQMAKTLDVPVLLLSQMDRVNSDSPEDLGKSADWPEKYMGDIQSDNIIFINRQEDQGKNKGVFVLAKNPSAQVAEIAFNFYPKYLLFQEVNPEQEEVLL